MNFKNPIDELIYLRKKVCCAEECMTAVLVSEDAMPVDPLALGDTYTVNIIVGGVTIATVFGGEETRAEILTALNLKFLNFKIIFTANANEFLVANITDNKAACDVTITVKGRLQNMGIALTTAFVEELHT